MLNEFYDFIAKKIYSFFQTAASEGSLLKGESFCLKVDNEEMVANITFALKEYATKNKAVGEYSYCREGKIVYNTYTIKVLDGEEIIIAAQIDGMTNDFLCATLRNAANEEQKPLLMISSNPIDSAKSGSRDMSARGMPFYSDQLISEIKGMINNSTQLTNTEKHILIYELQRRDADVFSDKKSIFEYKDLLSIMSSGKIDDFNFSGFRLFKVDGKNDYQNEKGFEIDKKIKENNQLFERIDRGIRFGNLESELSRVFEENTINQIEQAYKNEGENWSGCFTYAELLAAMEKKQSKTDNPLKIDDSNISIYGEIPLNSFSLGETFFIRNAGSQTCKKRTKNIIIFNVKKYSIIHLNVVCNTRIPNNNISSDDALMNRDGKEIVFAFERSEAGLSFHKVEISDSANDINYIFRICIMELAPEYMCQTIAHSFSIDYKRTKENSRIKMSGVETELVFNKNAEKTSVRKLNDNEVYTCKYDEKLIITSTDDELANFGNGIKIDINFSGIVVPFILYPDEPKSVEITGRKILKDKFSKRKSFIFEPEHDAIIGESQEYYAKTSLLREMRLEQEIINKDILTGQVNDFYVTERVKIDSLKLEIPESLKEAYLEMLKAFKKEKTIPTLAYLTNDLKDSVERYLAAFENCFENLKDGEILTREQESALMIGSLSIEKTTEEILLTPFHPLNLKYQLALLDESGMENATDVVIDRLNSLNLLPYIQRNKRIFKVSDQVNSQEWRYYAPMENKKYRGSRRYIPKLVDEKITEFISHFRYIFDDINNKTIRINLINMGDCSEVFIGLAQFYIHSIAKNADVEKLINFEIHIYTDNPNGNAFSNIKEYSSLKSYLAGKKLSVEKGMAMNSLEGIMSQNIDCYFHKDDGNNYEYAHVTFYEMESEITSESATMNEIETGISLDGILSGIPSSKYGNKYRTGYGTKYTNNVPLVRLSTLYNALMQVECTGNPYHPGTSISTQIDERAEYKMDHIYDSSNWVVFVDPKVDLDFFYEKEVTSDLLIIHYSDQYTSSSGYDAITVTKKSRQYSQVINEYLKSKGIVANTNDVRGIINLFNAVNGDWLLRLISSKRGDKASTFSREKISIVAAIKFMLAYLKHDDILWVPISLEEMLRVSGGVGLSKGEGVLSAKNLGFEKGPTCDDLLFVGLQNREEQPKIYLYPVEVKTGNNDSDVTKKAFEQVSATIKGLHNAFYSDEELNNTIQYKVNRNFLMQMLIISCKKMAVYHVDDSQDWDIALEKYRSALLNERYILSDHIQEAIGKGAVLSFKKTLIDRKKSVIKEEAVNFIEVPERDEFDLILKDVSDIYNDILERKDLDTLGGFDVENLTGDLSKFSIPISSEKDDTFHDDKSLKENQNMSANAIELNEQSEKNEENKETDKNAIKDESSVQKSSNGMNIIFGVNDQDGDQVVWTPNDTSQLFHTNTGIIGTMGTGKTQFTKSLITQLYREQAYNIGNNNLGILIFDYKGDYNESKADFVETTNATVLKPYNLPYNPLTLVKSSVFKPLLPTHTANAFKDTLTTAFGLGAKQQNALLQCIMDTYQVCGIYPEKPNTWNEEAPTFDQVYQRYANNEKIKKGDSLSAALDKLHMFKIFEANPKNTKSLFEILQGVVVIDLSGYDQDIQSLIVAITLDLFYAQMQAAGSSEMAGNCRQLTKFILVDEADNFMSKGFPALKKILKEGREFGVGTILSTQSLKHFGSGDDDYSKYILTWVVHNVSDLKNSDVDFVFKTEPKSQESIALYNAIKGLTKHHSIITIGNNKPVYVRDKAFWELYQELH